MKKFKSLLWLFLFSACSTDGPSEEAGDESIDDSGEAGGTEVLYRFPGGDQYEFGDPAGYVNQNGDTIIPTGKYSLCYTDTIVHYGVVLEKTKGKPTPIGIDLNGDKLYEIHWIDNGPDVPSEGLFRIIKDGKTGYADEITGEIIIEPRYQCAGSFEEGKAKVALECHLHTHPGDEFSTMESDQWIFIDKNGEIVP